MSKIKPEDLRVLVNVLNLPENVIIYDPENNINESIYFVVKTVKDLLQNAKRYSVCINLSSQRLEYIAFDFIFEIGNKNHKYSDFYPEEMIAFNNPDQSIRWFQLASAQKPNFLNLYNGSGWKAGIFRIATKLCFTLGMKRLICKNNFYLYSKKEAYFEKLMGTNEMAIFTGTVGLNRKAVAVICQDGKASHFVKIPVSGKSVNLVKFEYDHLKTLSGYDFKFLQIPDASLLGNGVKVSSISQKDVLAATKFSYAHERALRELYSNTVSKNIFYKTSVYQEVVERIDKLKGRVKCKDYQLCIMKVERLMYNLKVLFHSLNSDRIVPVAYAHGDFTPWNMFVSKNQLGVFDWELANKEQRLLFDAFHFIFQSNILILRQSFCQIKIKIHKLKDSLFVADLEERFQIDFQECYRWYLVYNCSYYLQLYLDQKDLHMQVDWLMDSWILATNDAIKAQQKLKVLSII